MLWLFFKLVLTEYENLVFPLRKFSDKNPLA